jgi:putative aminopeptidase FrvX
MAFDGEHWSKGETIRRATKLASLNGMELFIDFPNATKQKAEELGINLYAKVARDRSITRSFTAPRFDPFAGG